MVYLAMVAVFGEIHHHESGGALHDNQQCAACNWLVTGTSDVPVVDTPVSAGHVLCTALPIVHSAFVPNIYLTLFHSRAPPVAAA